MKSEHPCGRIGVQTIDVIAHKAASLLVDFEQPWALTMDPHGLVQLERVKNAHPDDWLGTFTGDAGLFGTSRLIRDELIEAVALRPPMLKPNRQPSGKRRPPKAA